MLVYSCEDIFVFPQKLPLALKPENATIMPVLQNCGFGKRTTAS